MVKVMFFAMMVFMASFLTVACSSEDPPAIPTNDVTTGDTDSAVQPDNQLPDTGLPDTGGTDTGGTDTGGETDSDTPVNDVQPDSDSSLPGDCATANLGKNCKTDDECGACLICVNAKCAEGCQSDSDCSSYSGTTCNKKLARCVNTVASSGACNETNCASGCCYAEKGFTALKCLKPAELAKCGICKQGEVYMDGKQCVPAACKVGETKCQTYNSTEARAKCYECKQTEYICYDNPSCKTGSTLMLLNAQECIPAGAVCSEGDVCCSGQPCIQGYCY